MAKVASGSTTTFDWCVTRTDRSPRVRYAEEGAVYGFLLQQISAAGILNGARALSPLFGESVAAPITPLQGRSQGSCACSSVSAFGWLSPHAPYG